MTIKIGINGFGRIGRLVLRAAANHPNLEVVAVNDLGDVETNAHLFKYDSVHGRFQGQVEIKDGTMVVNGRTVQVLAEKEPANLPWKDLGVQVVIESTGKFTDARDARKHLEAGAQKVIISAPGKNEDITMVMGVNHQLYNPAQHHIISNGSCTTNCLAPLAKVIHQNFNIQHALMTTIHSYTNDQRVLDLAHKDLRRARAASLSIIPTTTGAARAIGLVLPELKGKMNGLAMRVPTPNVSLVDLVANVAKSTTVDEVNAAFKAAAEGELKGILAYSDEPTVSRDYNGDPHSCIVDSLSTMVMEGTMIKAVAWYDNEWAYSVRCVDMAEYLAQKL
ncbi:MAG: type I glyceraldehyde-3-phosphate dehydrogenase [Syntrophomonadaceae bacterium]|nr:type I glyceraldehyde-3-phosphate dehydrogenase [Syntrophomonadaceae bacterium]